MARHSRRAKVLETDKGSLLQVPRKTNVMYSCLRMSGSREEKHRELRNSHSGGPDVLKSGNLSLESALEIGKALF